jgi:hypothetical protein
MHATDEQGGFFFVATMVGGSDAEPAAPTGRGAHADGPGAATPVAQGVANCGKEQAGVAWPRPSDGCAGWRAGMLRADERV